MTLVVVVLGGGGREHAIVKKLVEFDQLSVYAIPGNPGIAQERCVTCINTIDSNDHQAIIEFCHQVEVNLVVVGPEGPLAKGVVDSLEAVGIQVFGPCMAAAKLESDKKYAKLFMEQHNIPTARAQCFTTTQDAKDFIKISEWSGWAVKVSGLAGGKGVVVSADRERALDAVDRLRADHPHAAEVILVEEQLHGTEISAMGFTDGNTVVCMPFAQDHKTLYADNKGPNTGGMGAVCPFPVTENTARLCKDILNNTLKGLQKDKIVYKGVLYVGIMLVREQPFVLEYNCRFGDPETQAVLSLLDTMLFEIMQACVRGNLSTLTPKFAADTAACAVVVVTDLYPQSAVKGLPITGWENEATENKCSVQVFHNSTTKKEDVLVTNGGRVMTACATAPTLSKAMDLALEKAMKILFTGASFRDDIGRQAILANCCSKGDGDHYTYSGAGVSVAEGEKFVDIIKKTVRATHNSLVLEDIGSFGALFNLSAMKCKDPILVSGTDGVGTKLLVANALGRHDTIGQDLVAMCVNDIVCHGARPLFFLDYLATGKLDLKTLKDVVKGIAQACKETGTALVGGETAEMPGLYSPGEYDLAGFAVGVVEREDLLPVPSKMEVGDRVVGLASSGLHSNGFSLVRKIIEDHGLTYTDVCPFDDSKTIGDVLLTPTRLYADAFTRAKDLVIGAAHITGGGIIGNAARMLPKHLAVQLDIKKWTVPKEFLWISQKGVSPEEMSKTFNLGLGMLFVVKEKYLQNIMTLLEKYEVFDVGNLVKRGEHAVIINNLSAALFNQRAVHTIKPIKIAVLISGRGSNMQAIVNQSLVAGSPVEVVMVMSNTPDAAGVQWAADKRLNTEVLNHKDFSGRKNFECAMNDVLVKHEVQLVCLAGFMRILTETFVSKWKDRLINIHPSILPSFKGKDAQKQALEAKVKLTGCTVHFVEVEVDSGAIIDQESVRVLADDTEESLSARIRDAEHRIFPRAVMSVAAAMLKKRDIS